MAIEILWTMGVFLVSRVQAVSQMESRLDVRHRCNCRHGSRRAISRRSHPCRERPRSTYHREFTDLIRVCASIFKILKSLCCSTIDFIQIRFLNLKKFLVLRSVLYLPTSTGKQRWSLYARSKDAYFLRYIIMKNTGRWFSGSETKALSDEWQVAAEAYPRKSCSIRISIIKNTYWLQILGIASQLGPLN